MKKTTKRAGAAIISMAMLLSMGALAMPAAAATPTQLTVTDVKITKAAPGKYTLYKIASAAKDANSEAVTYTLNSDYASVLKVNGGLIANKDAITDGDTTVVAANKSLKDMQSNHAEIQAIAKKLAAVAVTKQGVSTATVQDNTTSTTLNLDGAGYYLILGDTNAITMPILVSVLPDGTVDPIAIKNSDIPFTKAITKIQNDYSEDDLIGTDAEGNNGGTGISEDGGVVTYTLSTVFPKYSSEVKSFANGDKFTITDISEDSIVIKKDTIKVYIDDSDTATEAGANTFDITYDLDVAALKASGVGLTDKAAGTFVDTVTTDGTTGFQITFADSFVLSQANRGKNVKVVFDADVVNPDTEDNSNDNGATLSYSNNYFTGKGHITDDDGDGNPEEHPDEPKVIPDDAKIYTSLIRAKKTDPDGNQLPGAVFALYALDDNNQETLVQTIDSSIAKIPDPADPTKEIDNPYYNDAIFTFSGLGEGKYVLREESAPAGYTKAEDVVITITAGKDVTVPTMYNGSFVKKDGDQTITDDTVPFVNYPTQQLPGTGGIGIYLFTIGGAAIVLLAGVLFVLYMKKRETEE